MRMPIEMNAFTAKLGEGAAVRLGRTITQTDGETHIYFEPWEETKAVVLSDAYVEHPGRTLDVCMTLRGVCPGRRTAVGLALSEVDDEGKEYARGFRAITMPAHPAAGCSDLEIPLTRFVVPEETCEAESRCPCAERCRPVNACEAESRCPCAERCMPVNACEERCHCRRRRHFVMRTTTHYVD
ncbi:MAG: hypothetical protein RSC91_03055 [Clostridia bacterium]